MLIWQKKSCGIISQVADKTETYQNRQDQTKHNNRSNYKSTRNKREKKEQGNLGDKEKIYW
jgi:hypothetical protein